MASATSNDSIDNCIFDNTIGQSNSCSKSNSYSNDSNSLIINKDLYTSDLPIEKDTTKFSQKNSSSKDNGSYHLLMRKDISQANDKMAYLDPDDFILNSNEFEIYDEMFSSDGNMIDESSDNEKSYTGDKELAGPSEIFQMLFILISFGYMLPWTSLGSLISYYKANYSAYFYAKLYCAFYLPGLPVALFQYQFDTTLDSIYGSQITYLLRGLISYIIMMGILISLMFYNSELILIFLFGCIGKNFVKIYILIDSMWQYYQFELNSARLLIHNHC